MDAVSNTLDEIAVEHHVRISRLEENFYHLLRIMRKKQIERLQEAQLGQKTTTDVETKEVSVQTEPDTIMTEEPATSITDRHLYYKINDELHNIKVERLYMSMELNDIRAELRALKRQVEHSTSLTQA
jgi:hypothetical protein